MIFTSNHHDIQQSCFQNPIITPPPKKKKTHSILAPQIWTNCQSLLSQANLGQGSPETTRAKNWPTNIRKRLTELVEKGKLSSELGPFSLQTLVTWRTDATDSKVALSYLAQFFVGSYYYVIIFVSYLPHFLLQQHFSTSIVRFGSSEFEKKLLLLRPGLHVCPQSLDWSISGSE